ncbi:triphosphoribosyl-dephospho-CoA synthase [Desulfovibrio intestinalis]|uniref:triphosphoribosyl-dephospho-CoA synthase n=1 Tax=Desulfovibrio intestinalis TaxID=58621 RepID=A0A7W8C0U6_9BACT|nr:triphosphoribosyl-dephospho-CoA synthase [Desulfovibrio intestinalis]MBB5142109.1 triphosphoribosyl-dephospho-CoA synthetase [Desulfovibrio intestinalis]
MQALAVLAPVPSLLELKHFHTYAPTRQHTPRMSSARVGELATRAAILEAAAGPKPGLVCRNSQGSHADMDYTTFVRSALALQGYFTQAHALGTATTALEPPTVFPRLRALGLKAEQDMFAATKGVNTHKGLIFSLGLFCAALGRLGSATSVQKLCHTAASFVQGITGTDMAALPCGPLAAKQAIPGFCPEKARHARPKAMRPLLENGLQRNLTPGEVIYIMYGMHGVRGEAEQGFPGVALACERLERHGAGVNMNRATVHTLLELLAHVEDSSLLWRGGGRGFALARAYAAATLAAGGQDTADGRHMLNRMGAAFVRRKLSPGGCADMLATGIFLHLLRRHGNC